MAAKRAPSRHGSNVAAGGDAGAAASAGAHGAGRARAVLCAFGARPRPRRKLYGLPQTDFGEFWLGPRPGGLGLLADLAGRRPHRAGGRPRLRPLGPARGVFIRRFPAGRGVPDRGLRTASLAIPAHHRPLCRLRRRADRQRPQFHPARALVRTAAADRHGRGLFRHGRRRAAAVAGVADPDRSCRLARHLSAIRRDRARGAVAGRAVAVAAFRRRRTARHEEG